MKLKNTSVPCPECDTPLTIAKKYQIGKILECPACGTENEILTENPVTIAPLEEEK